MKHIKIMLMTIGMFSLCSCVTKKPEAAAKVKHVVVIGFDGLSPDGLEKAVTPTFDKLIREGASTLHARAVLPTSSSPNWASMIMGAGPEQHGITSNSWEKNNHVLPAVSKSEDFLFPTIFHLVNSQVKNAEIGAIYHWTGFGRLFEKSAMDYDISPETAEETANLAGNYLKSNNPTFTFVHFDHVDHAGHEFGHGSSAYYKSVEKADALLAQLINAIKSSDMVNETVVIISSDHGGVGLGHGGESLKEMEIPFIVWGKSVKKNHKLTQPVYQYDNAATVAFALGLKRPLSWIGKPVKNAFEGFEETDAYPVVERLKEPIILPKAIMNKKAGGLFDDEVKVIVQNPNDMGEIRYTLDGTMPNNNAAKYTVPFKLTNNTVVKSTLFKNGDMVSTVSEAYFRVKKKHTVAPVTYEVFYLKNLNSIPVLENRTVDIMGRNFEITSDEVAPKIKDNTVVRFTTKITIEKEDTYTFYIRSDDGSKLWIDGKEVVDNDGDHGVKEKDGSIELKPGIYPLKVVWYNGGGGSWLDVFYKSNELPKQIVPTTVLQIN